MARPLLERACSDTITRMKSDKEDSVKRSADPALASTLASNDDDDVDLSLTAATLHEKVKLGAAAPKEARIVPIVARDVPTGTLFGNFEVVRKVGQGGMGVVYEARHRHIGRKAAIKVMHREWAQRPDYTDRFLNEARAVNIIQHPGLVEIFEYGQQPDGTLFIVMEFLQGESLEQRMQKQGLPLPEHAVIDIALQLARALTAAHEKGVIHRDLKPDDRRAIAEDFFLFPFRSRAAGKDRSGRFSFRSASPRRLMFTGCANRLSQASSSTKPSNLFRQTECEPSSAGPAPTQASSTIPLGICPRLPRPTKPSLSRRSTSPTMLKMTAL